MSEPVYGLDTAPPARRALGQRLPLPAAEAAAEFITGPLLINPRRVGKPLGEELSGIYSARPGRDWRILYEIDEIQRTVLVLDIRHRSTAYRPR
ncbi:type II toxin-antitoxin system RelE family toxin [Pseudonocardia spinosispora]|uniref:type II toxin-antitoxin system RelE family toxin n=1 Tax=Pseudonocardia spinosispora TaxID=103441 RepID=UPI0009FD26C4